MMSDGFRKYLARIARRIPVNIALRSPRRKWPGETDRFEYQEKYVEFEIQPGNRVLDVGSGPYPFPHATVLVDRFIETTRHRSEELVTHNKPFLVADVGQLPFADKSFDFVYCSHLLEHVPDPVQACSEIARVGTRGFIETPNFAKDALFAWAERMHRWHVVSIADRLVFFEYSPRQLKGIRSSIWQDIVLKDLFHHPLQAAFYENQDIFNTMLLWNGGFKVAVFCLNGSIRTADFRCAS